MSLINLPYTFVAGNTIIASQHNSNFTTVYNLVNGNLDNTNIATSAGIVYSKLSLTGSIVNADINASAGIVDSKLAQITTASKVSGTSLTSLASIPSGAGNIPLANLGNVPTTYWVPTNITVYSTNGTYTWTKPAGVSSVYVKVWGAGGGGGGTNSAGTAAGGGGGGYSEGYTAVTGNVTVTIGTGGSQGSSSNGTGGTGGTSSFAGTSTIQATGGSGGGGSTSGTGGSGGAGSGGILNISGVAGGYGSSYTGITNGSPMGAGGFSYSFNFTYPTFDTSSTSDGITGKSVGSGGSGGKKNSASSAGGLGADGMVIVYY